jgi:hypothetical protein
LKQQIKTPLWKAFWLWALPLLVVYQLLWGQVFNGLQDAWGYAQFSQLILFKLITELVIYMTLPIYLCRATAASSRYGHLVVAVIFAIIFGLTLEALLGRFFL